MATRVSAFAQSDLFVAERSFPAGLAYRDDLITAAEECILLEHLKSLPICTPRFAKHCARPGNWMMPRKPTA
jgi:hypothetical protein